MLSNNKEGEVAGSCRFFGNRMPGDDEDTQLILRHNPKETPDGPAV